MVPGYSSWWASLKPRSSLKSGGHYTSLQPPPPYRHARTRSPRHPRTPRTPTSCLWSSSRAAEPIPPPPPKIDFGVVDARPDPSAGSSPHLSLSFKQPLSEQQPLEPLGALGIGRLALSIGALGLEHLENCRSWHVARRQSTTLADDGLSHLPADTPPIQWSNSPVDRCDSAVPVRLHAPAIGCPSWDVHTAPNMASACRTSRITDATFARRSPRRPISRGLLSGE